MLLLAELLAEVPTSLVAVIAKVYAVLDAKDPVTVRGLDVPLVDSEIEGELVTVYEVIGNLELGAVKASDTVVELVTVAVPTTGAPGTLLADDP